MARYASDYFRRGWGFGQDEDRGSYRGHGTQRGYDRGYAPRYDRDFPRERQVYRTGGHAGHHAYDRDYPREHRPLHGYGRDYAPRYANAPRPAYRQGYGRDYRAGYDRDYRGEGGYGGVDMGPGSRFYHDLNRPRGSAYGGFMPGQSYFGGRHTLTGGYL